MPYPVPAVVDDFNRADEGPPASGWSGSLYSGFGIAPSIISNQLASSAPSPNGWYSAGGDYGPDVVALMTMGNIGTGTNQWHINARIVGEGSAAVDDYHVRFSNSGGAVTIERADDNANTTLASATQAVSAGDQIGIHIAGVVITALYRPAGGVLRPLVSAVDATYRAAGKVGLYAADQSTAFDDFAVMTINPAGRFRYPAFPLARGI